MEAYTKHISATWPRKRFLSPTLASLYKNHLFLTMRHVWNPDLLSHPKLPKRGHHHLAHRPLLSASRSRTSKIAPIELHLQISITYGQRSFCFPKKRLKCSPPSTGNLCHSSVLQHASSLSTPYSLFELDQMNFLLLSFPPHPTPTSFPHGYLYPEYLSF